MTDQTNGRGAKAAASVKRGAQEKANVDEQCSFFPTHINSFGRGDKCHYFKKWRSVDIGESDTLRGQAVGLQSVSIQVLVSGVCQASS